MRLSQRDYYGKALVDLSKIRQDIVVIDADLASSTKTSKFQEAAPEKFIEVGIAEQNMIGIASGLAASGRTVFVSTFAVFATGRCWEQIRLAVAYPKQNVKIVSTHCGVNVGEDGASHQSLEDISIMRSIPNMTVISPADAYETYAATMALADYMGPCYMRLGRATFPIVTEENTKFRIGCAKIMKEGEDVTLFGTGQMLSLCLRAAEELKRCGINAEVINISTIKPLDTNTVIKSVKKTRCAVSAEEHNIIGGLGSAIAETLSENIPVPLIRVGMKDTFGESGKFDELMTKYDLTVDAIFQAARQSISKRKQNENLYRHSEFR
ncbi:MAG: transketolase family protein [archaeon]|nr:transketolase family protein [archaeon]